MKNDNSHVFTLKDGSKRKVSLVEVTKEMAEELLERNTCNRKQKTGNLRNLEQDLKDEKFIGGIQPILIYENGVIADGQHQLRMIARTGIPAELFIVENIPVEAKNIIDTGVSRSNSDILSINGHTYTSTLAAAANVVMSMRAAEGEGRSREFSTQHSIKYSPRVTVEEIKNNPLYEEFAPFAYYTIGDNTTIMSRGLILSMVVYLIGDKGHRREQVEDFFLQIADHKPACGTIRTLRKLLGSKDKRTQLSSEAISTYIKKAWNAFAEGRYELTKIYFK